MGLIFFLAGILLGVLCTIVYKSRERIHGIVHIDHDTEQCTFSLTSDQLSNRKHKIAVFYINHNAKISREEQSL